MWVLWLGGFHPHTDDDSRIPFETCTNHEMKAPPYRRSHDDVFPLIVGLCASVVVLDRSCFMYFSFALAAEARP